MAPSAVEFPTEHSAVLLSRLLFSQELAEIPTVELTRAAFNDLASLANTNHVIVRAVSNLRLLLLRRGDAERVSWADEALGVEHARIGRAIPVLKTVCDGLNQAGLGVIVIKSLDHWPDLGSDLDLYTDASAAQINEAMQQRFGARIAPQSWGDSLACKWNYYLPELPEAIEIHIGRLGQTGEQHAIASGMIARSRSIEVGDYTFRTSHTSDRILISTLQRMYRHFFFRLCDIVDSADLVESGLLDFDDLRSAATRAGIWEGVATYLLIVSDYLKKYRGTGLALPAFVSNAAHFGGLDVYYARGFLRVPLMPQSARLYRTQLTGLLRRGDLGSGARLSLLPWLATAAYLGEKITGSDKGIW